MFSLKKVFVAACALAIAATSMVIPSISASAADGPKVILEPSVVDGALKLDFSATGLDLTNYPYLASLSLTLDPKAKNASEVAMTAIANFKGAKTATSPITGVIAASFKPSATASAYGISYSHDTSTANYPKLQGDKIALGTATFALNDAYKSADVKDLPLTLKGVTVMLSAAAEDSTSGTINYTSTGTSGATPLAFEIVYPSAKAPEVKVGVGTTVYGKIGDVEQKEDYATYYIGTFTPNGTTITNVQWKVIPSAYGAEAKYSEVKAVDTSAYAGSGDFALGLICTNVKTEDIKEVSAELNIPAN